MQGNEDCSAEPRCRLQHLRTFRQKRQAHNNRSWRSLTRSWRRDKKRPQIQQPSMEGSLHNTLSRSTKFFASLRKINWRDKNKIKKTESELNWEMAPFPTLSRVYEPRTNILPNRMARPCNYFQKKLHSHLQSTNSRAGCVLRKDVM